MTAHKSSKRIVWIASSVLLIAMAAGIGIWLGPRSRGQAILEREPVNLDRVLEFAQRCNDSYHDHQTFRREYGAHVEVGEFPVSGLRIYLDTAPQGGAQWVMVRGTANLPNVIEDLEFIGHTEHELGIHVHTGFDKALQECLPWVLKRLDRARPVWVTGHSLGGAVAELLIATLDHRGFKDVSGITFGQPKVTNARGVASLAHLKLLRVVHESDPVPMLPPVFVELDKLGIYHHSGPELIVRPDGTLTCLHRHLADRLDVRSYWADLRSIVPEAHDMTKGYLPALHKARSGAKSNGG